MIVVRPTSKREKKKRKRQLDPNRQGYLDILQKSGGESAYELGGSSQSSITDGTLVAPHEEAAAVAAAIGLPPNYSPSLNQPGSSMAQPATAEVSSPVSATTTDETLSDAPRSPGVVMKSPDLANLESPAASGSCASEEDGDEGSGVVLEDSGLLDPQGNEANTATVSSIHSGHQVLKDTSSHVPPTA